MATWSSITVQCDLNNLTKFLKLRLEKHAQYEIQLIARAMYMLAGQVFPATMGVFSETMLDSTIMSLDATGFQYEKSSLFKESFEPIVSVASLNMDGGKVQVSIL